MHQVVFRLPYLGLPIYGFGLMLFAAFLGCTWLASWRAKRDGVAPEHVQNLALWIFLPGLIGARITFMIQDGRSITEFFEIWKGGLVFYGSLFGGFLGYLAGYYLIIRKHGLSAWKIADIIAPSVALGLALGRIGCLLNGCCYGNVACVDCPAVHFPLSAPARYTLVEAGRQTAAGFALADQSSPALVSGVEPGSPAEEAGLRAGDVILKVNEEPVKGSGDMWRLLVRDWPRGEKDLQLSVARAGQAQAIVLPVYRPVTLGLHPTQLYETISTTLILLVLLAYTPFRRRDGEIIVLFLVCYAIHRFVNEILRNDTDPVAFGLTLSQCGSIILLAVSLMLIAYLGMRKPVQYHPGASHA